MFICSVFLVIYGAGSQNNERLNGSFIFNTWNSSLNIGVLNGWDFLALSCNI